MEGRWGFIAEVRKEGVEREDKPADLEGPLFTPRHPWPLTFFYTSTSLSLILSQPYSLSLPLLFDFSLFLFCPSVSDFSLSSLRLLSFSLAWNAIPFADWKSHRALEIIMLSHSSDRSAKLIFSLYGRERKKAP